MSVPGGAPPRRPRLAEWALERREAWELHGSLAEGGGGRHISPAEGGWWPAEEDGGWRASLVEEGRGMGAAWCADGEWGAAGVEGEGVPPESSGERET